MNRENSISSTSSHQNSKYSSASNYKVMKNNKEINCKNEYNKGEAQSISVSEILKNKLWGKYRNSTIWVYDDLFNYNELIPNESGASLSKNINLTDIVKPWLNTELKGRKIKEIEININDISNNKDTEEGNLNSLVNYNWV